MNELSNVAKAQTEFESFLMEFSGIVNQLQETRCTIGEKVRSIKNMTTPSQSRDADKNPEPSGALEQANYILGNLKNELSYLEEIKSQLCRIV